MSKTLNLSVSMIAVIASSMTMMACAKNSGSSSSAADGTSQVATQEQVKPNADAAGCPALDDGNYEQKDVGPTDSTNRLNVSTMATTGNKVFTMMGASFVADGVLHFEQNQPSYVAICKDGRVSIAIAPELKQTDDQTNVKFSQTFFVETKGSVITAGVADGEGKDLNTTEFVKMSDPVVPSSVDAPAQVPPGQDTGAGTPPPMPAEPPVEVPLQSENK